jgi:hypothetical protein
VTTQWTLPAGSVASTSRQLPWSRRKAPPDRAPGRLGTRSPLRGDSDPWSGEAFDIIALPELESQAVDVRRSRQYNESAHETRPAWSWGPMRASEHTPPER